MIAQKCYQMNTTDSKEIKKLMVDNGLKVTMCRLGSNRFYLQLHTSNNVKAIEILNSTKFAPSMFDLQTSADLRNQIDIMVRKTEK